MCDASNTNVIQMGVRQSGLEVNMGGASIPIAFESQFSRWEHLSTFAESSRHRGRETI